MFLEIFIYSLIIIAIFIHAAKSIPRRKEVKVEITPCLLEKTLDDVSPSGEDEIREMLRKAKDYAESLADEYGLSESNEAPEKSQEAEHIENEVEEEDFQEEEKVEDAIDEPDLEPDLEEKIDKAEETKKEALKLIHNVEKVPALKDILDYVKGIQHKLSAEAKKAIFAALVDYSLAGEESSIVRDTSDEIVEYSTTFDLLSKVKLVEHVRNVVFEIDKEAREFPGFFERLIEPFVLAALYHDIGKISFHRKKFSQAEYRMLDHPVISSHLLQERYSSADKSLIEAVQMHHKSSYLVDNQVFQALKSADQAARRSELMALSSEAPSLKDVISEEEIIQIIFDTYVEEDVESKLSQWPKIFTVDGFVLIKIDAYCSAVEKHLSKIRKICREQILSKEQFYRACLQLLVEYSIINEKVLNAKVYLERRLASRSRRIILKNYLPISLEKLAILESQTTSSFNNFKKVIIEV